MTDAGLMERTLEALAGREDQLRIALFERFFAEFPARRADFLAFDASSRRMADETLQLLYGMATGADWLWTQTADLVDLHRAYGALPQIEFEALRSAKASMPAWMLEALRRYEEGAVAHG